MGKQSGHGTPCFGSDTEALTKKEPEYKAKNLADFDAVLYWWRP